MPGCASQHPCGLGSMESRAERIPVPPAAPRQLLSTWCGLLKAREVSGSQMTALHMENERSTGRGRSGMSSPPYAFLPLVFVSVPRAPPTRLTNGSRKFLCGVDARIWTAG